MSAEVLTKKLEQAPIPTDLKRDLGERACAGCPLIQLGCPGKAEAVADCPPAAEKIKQAEVTRAIVEDDNVGAVYADSGGFYAVPGKAAKLQSTTLIKPAEVPKRAPKPAKPAVKTPEHRPRPKGGGVLQAIGEFVAALVLPMPKAK